MLHKQPNNKVLLTMKKFFSLILAIGTSLSVFAQHTLTLDSCRTLALKNNKELLISREKVNAAHYEKKAAFTNYLPKIEIAGGYMRTQKEISLLSDEQKQTIGNLGTAAGSQLQQGLQALAAQNPGLAAGLQGLLPGAVAGVTNGLNAVGEGIVNALRTDTRNLTVGAATLTQPIFMGGKIIAYNKITKYAEQLAEAQHATGLQDIILNTDQAYWQVVSLANKKKLAKADALSVKVKVNEAEMTLTQVENGLSLSKMVLCQLCGLPLDTDITLADEDMSSLTLPNAYTEANVNTALANRQELKSLELASEIYRQKVNVVRSDFLPSVAVTANYLVTNPSLVNGFENRFRGMWAAGVIVKIPVFHWGEGIYKVKAAQAEANIAQYKLDDVKEKVELQVTQSSYKVNEAAKRLTMAEKNMEKAEENLRYANLGFKEGVIPTSNVLEAQTAWLSAQSGKIDAQIDVKLSELYLNKSMGTLK